VDEEHETAFKQEEGVVYHARDMAVVRARMNRRRDRAGQRDAEPRDDHERGVREYRRHRLPAQRHRGAAARSR
jgi:primosomal protein N' (replication factor Y)